MNEEMFEQAEFAFQHSWETHRQAFGPILEPAFKENPQVRITLTAALNHISRRNIKRGLEILQSIKDVCVYHEDKAAWTFCVGLCFDMAGAKEQMMLWYKEAANFGHRFYLPYLKIAKTAHNDAAFDEAEKYYLIAIDCLNEMDADERDETIFASVYTNLVSCLTMMHRYKDAKLALNKISPIQPGSIAVAAILYAAMGNADMVSRLIEAMKVQLPELVEKTKKMTEMILSGTHPHFNAIPVEPDNIKTFWNWFCDNKSCIDQNNLSEQLMKALPFMNREPQPNIVIHENRKMIIFHDFYAIGLHYGYTELLKACPSELHDRWSFTIVH